MAFILNPNCRKDKSLYRERKTVIIQAMSINITGTLINAAAVLLGGGIGLLLKGRIPKKFAEHIARSIGLCVCIIGIAGAIKGDFMLLAVSLALGTLTGELLYIEEGLNKLGLWMQNRWSRNEAHSTFAEGFVVSTLLFCVGAMAVVGSLESGLGQGRDLIFAKSVLDGVSSMVLASTLGLGVLLSAGVILLYQGSIEAFAGSLQNVLTPPLIVQISAAGGVMILGIGLNMTLNAKIRVANLLPGLLFAAGYYNLFIAS
jgi:uncharacterized membrane protein YqgA involved in biofilm formation